MAESNDNSTGTELRLLADEVIASGTLGRSRFYRTLLEYLVACAEQSRIPKEVEIAADVFQRGEDFDSGQDSMVRVYVHNLRQKLDQYYRNRDSDGERRLFVPKGEYKIVVGAAEPDLQAAPTAAPPAVSRRGLAYVAAGLTAGLALGWLAADRTPGVSNDYSAIAASPFWNRILDDERPITVVVGDYFIFGELDERGDVGRLVREFAVNSPADLADLAAGDATARARFLDLDLTYLPSGAATAVGALLRVVYTTGKRVRIVPMSDLDVSDLRDNHVIYAGYLSGLDKLIDFVFMASELAIGTTYDQLVDMASGEEFSSEAGIPSGQRNYRDYGLVSVFPGPNGNEVMILAGTRDEGLMHSALSVSDRHYVDSALAALTAEYGEVPDAFEILWEVAGFDRTNLDATIVHTAIRREDGIWSGELTMP